MFSDWTDPYDIDHYYDDLQNAYKDKIPISNKVDVVLPSATSLPLAPEKPIGPVINTTPATSTAPSSAPIKSGFTLTPDTIFVDGHPVGSQPLYNTLRSGPPREPFLGNPDNLKDCRPMNWCYIITFIAFTFLVCVICHMKSQLHNNQLTMKMLMMMCTRDGTIKKM